jgi:hypothetical protein
MRQKHVNIYIESLHVVPGGESHADRRLADGRPLERVVPVSMDGSFRWSRKARANVTWWVYITGSEGARLSAVAID